jgi:dynein intermediate chain
MAEKSLVLERALGEASVYDILVDYGGGDAVERRDGSDAIKTLMAFHDKHWCSERAVTDVHWSPHYSELLLASYTAKGQRLDSHGVDSGPVPASTFNGDPDGLLLVWSLASTSRTEMMFQSQSTILAARFHDFDSHLLLGGAYSGQIFLWDTRSKSLPVQRSRLSAEGHTHPVYSLSIVGESGTVIAVTQLCSLSSFLISSCESGRHQFFPLPRYCQHRWESGLVGP